MLNMTWEFKLEPTAEQVSEIDRTLEVCRNVWNFALRERKELCASLVYEERLSGVLASI